MVIIYMISNEVFEGTIVMTIVAFKRTSFPMGRNMGGPNGWVAAETGIFTFGALVIFIRWKTPCEELHNSGASANPLSGQSGQLHTVGTIR